jgi:Fe-S-cluster containining protein
MSDSKTEWYGDGLRFGCHGCGHCCRVPGYVWVEEDDIDRLTVHLGITRSELGRSHIRLVGGRLSLIERAGSTDCVFWDNGCQVYDARPEQCRTFPFWPDNLENEGAWEAVLSECPGAGSGRLYKLTEIHHLARGRGGTAPGPSGGCDTSGAQPIPQD